MELLDLLDKRRHCVEFKEEAPDHNLIMEAFYKAWKVTPSKQNFMPYMIHLLGPDSFHEKLLLHQKAKYNKKYTNETEDVHNINHKELGHNANYEYLESAPYVYIIEQRICEPNPSIARDIEMHHDYYEQMHEKDIGKQRPGVSLEVGLFLANLTGFLLEKNISLNINACIPFGLEHWKDMPFITYNPLIVGAIGYCEATKRQRQSDFGRKFDRKPELDKILTVYK